MKPAFAATLGVLGCLNACRTPEAALFSGPVLLDTAWSASSYRTESWLSTGIYPPLYLGPMRDTLILDQDLKYRPIARRMEVMVHGPEWPPAPADACFVHWRSEREYKRPTIDAISIMVDTTQIIASVEAPVRPKETTVYKAYGVLVKNLVSDTLEVGYGEYLRMTMEARTQAGEWRPIEERFGYFCGVGVGTIVLPPGYVAITSAPIYEGDLEAECRLNLDGVRSNVFQARINRQQFEGRYGKH